jgi:hypothetical protein
MRTHRRIAGFLIGPAIASASLLFAAPASAQAVPAPATPSATSLAESITVNGAGSGAASSFVQSAASSTHISGKIARWEVPICPYAVGMPADVIARVLQKVKGVATQAGAPVSSKPDCKPNIVVAFTSTPQSLLDNIRKDHTEWLGFHTGPGELDRLATVTHPIQAWYSTATVDLQGRHQNDAPRSGNGRGLEISAPCILIGGGGKTPGNGSQGNGYRDPNFMCTMWLPDAIKTNVDASRLANGLRATFDHVTIVANPLAIPAGLSAIEDYIAIMALAQINSLDKCRTLPSITNLLAAGCVLDAQAITANDLAYLKALYAADPGGLLDIQKNEIARRMEQAMAGSSH